MNRISCGALHFCRIVVFLAAAVGGVRAADYTWTGNGADANWSTTNNWGALSFPRAAGDTVSFTSANPPRQPTLNVNATVDVVNLTGPTNWTIGGTSTLLLNTPAGINHATVFTNTVSPKLSGNFGIAITSGVLVLNNSANLFTGGLAITGGVLDVSASAFNVTAATAAGSNATSAVLGDATAGLDAEIRLGGGGNRGITVQGGAGGRTIRTVGNVGSSSAAYTNNYTLNADTIFAPGLASDAFNASTLYNINAALSGTGGLVVAGANTIVLGNTNNSYTGRTTVKAGVLRVTGNVISNGSFFGFPAAGREEVLIGDTAGTNNATLYVKSSQFYRPIRSVAGSTGWNILDISGKGDTFWSPITLDKDLYVKAVDASSTIFTNTVTGPGALILYQSGTAYGTGLTYINPASPAYRGGTTISSNLTLQWTYPTMLPGESVVRFGSNADGSGPALITLDGGCFIFSSTTNLPLVTRLTLENPFAVLNGRDSRIIGYAQSGNSYNLFSGPISLGGRLTTFSGNYGSANALLGDITLTQTTPRRVGVLLDSTSAGSKEVWVSGNIQDGPGEAGNALALKANYGYGYSTVGLYFSGVRNTYSGGTIVEAGSGTIMANSPAGSLGTGPIWVQEGGWLRLNAPWHVPAGQSLNLYGCSVQHGVVAVAGNFLPSLTSDSAGVLAIDTMGGYNAVSSLATLGNGRMYLGTLTNGAFTGATLAPCSDNVYRLLGNGGRGASLSILGTNVLTGASASLQVGTPYGIVGKEQGIPNTLGWGRVYLAGAQDYGSGSVVNYNSTLDGLAQTNGTPFGSTAGVTLNGGFLQLTGGSAPATNDIGTLNVNGYGVATPSQAGTALTCLSATLGTRSNTTPWILTVSGGSSGLSLGGSKERFVLPGGAPAVVNGMLPPYLMTLRNTIANRPYAGVPDYVTYNSSADALGTIGFTNASSGYSTVTDAASFQALPATAIANVSNSTLSLTGPASVHALRVENTLSTGLQAITNNGTARTITIGSGGIMFNNTSGSSGGSFAIANNVVLGGEGVINMWCRSDDNVYADYAYFLGSVAGTNGLTINAQRTGYVCLYGANSGLTGTIAAVRGWLQYTNDNALGAASNPIYLDGGGLRWNGGIVNARPIYVGPGGGQFYLSVIGTNSGAITGPGQMVLSQYNSGTQLAIAGTNNTYSGGSLLSVAYGSSIFVLSNATLGVGDVMIAPMTSGQFYGDRAIGGGDCYGANTTSRQARLTIIGNVYNQTPGSVYFWSATPSIGSLSGAGSLYLSNTVLTLGGDNSSTIFDGLIAPTTAGTSGSLRKVGSGTFAFKGASTVTGTTVVDEGTFAADGPMSGGITVNSGATLTVAAGNTVGPLTVNGSGTLVQGRPGAAGALSASGLTLNTNAVNIDIEGAAQYDRFLVAGSAVLNAPTLSINLQYAPLPWDSFTIIDATGGVSGQFWQGGSPLADGASVNCGTYNAVPYYGTIRYIGSDVILTNLVAVQSPPWIGTLAATDVTTNAANLNGALTTTGTSSTAVTLFWGPTDGGTNAGDWQNGVLIDPAAAVCPAVYSTNLAGLAANTTFWYAYRASNAAGTAWGQPSASFTTLGAPVLDNASGAANVSMYTATLVGHVAAGLPSPAVYFCWGTNDPGVASTAAWQSVVAMGVRSGTFSNNVTGLLPGTTYWYRCYGSNSYGEAWADSATSFVARASYTWTGQALDLNNRPDPNWTNPLNWLGGTGYPNSLSEGALFDPASTNQPTVNIGIQLATLTAAGANSWAWSGAATVTNNRALVYGSTGTSIFSPAMTGTGSVVVTAGVLTNNSAASVYTGPTIVKGGALEVSAAAFNTNAASAAGSNAAPVQLGDPAAGTDAELRLGKGGNRGIVVQAGVGQRTIRPVGNPGSAVTYTSTYTLNADTIFAPGYTNDPFNLATIYNINSTLTGTGSLIVANGANVIALGNTNNSYTGRTIINGGVLQVPDVAVLSSNALGRPAPGNEEILLGDTSGSANAALRLGSGNPQTWTNSRPLRVRAGSSGTATLDSGFQNNYALLCGPLTLEKDLYIRSWYYNNSFTISNAVTGPGGLRIYQSTLGYTDNAGNRAYVLTNQPTFTGGLTISSNLVFAMRYPGVAGDDKLIRFGNAPGGGPGTITLDGGMFRLYPTNGAARYSNDNEVVVNGNHGWLQGSFSAVNGTNLFVGPIALGGILTVGDFTSTASLLRYLGTVTLDQSVGGRRGLVGARTSYTLCALDGDIVDGAGPAANSLLLRATALPAPIVTGTGSTFANGTVVDGDVAGMFDVQSASGALGSGDFWLLEGGRLRLNQPFHVNTAGGAQVTLYGNQACLSVLGLGADFVPNLASDAFGVLAVDTAGYDAVTSLAALGNGRMYLGSITNGIFTGASLAPCTDNIYRLGGGGGTLTLNNGVLAGSGNALQVGAPTCGGTLLLGTTYGNGSGKIILLAANSYSGSTVNAGSTLEGQAQASGSPFGDAAAAVALNNGALQVDGTNVANTESIGPLRISGYGSVTMNQPTFVATNTLVIDSLGVRSNAAPWSAVWNGSAATRLGTRERIVINNNPPAVVNNIVAPYLVTAYNGTPDFLTYNSASDDAGVIGFTNASAYYTTAGSAAALNGVPANGVANVTASFAMTQNVTDYALRIGAYTLSGAYTNMVTGGGVIFNGNGTISAGLAFGAEGVVYAGVGNPTISGRITGTNGLTKFGPRTLTLSGVNAGLTGTLAVVQGYLKATSDINLGAPENPIYLDGGGLEMAFPTSTNNRPVYLGPSGGIMDNGGSSVTMTWGGAITGPGLFAKIDGGGGNWFALTLTNAYNTYSGGTFVYGSTGSLNVRPNSSLGVGDVTAAGQLWLYGDRNIGGGDMTTPDDDRDVRLSIQPSGAVYFLSATPSVGSLSGSGNPTPGGYGYTWGGLFLSNTVLTVGSDNSSTLFDGMVYQTGISTGSIRKVGSGTFTFKGVSTALGTWSVDNGKLVVDGSLASGVTVNNGGTLAGAGSMGTVTVGSGGTYQPGTVVTNSAARSRMSVQPTAGVSLSSGAAVVFNVYGPTNYTQIVSSGPVALNSATLQVNFFYKPSPADVFDLVLNSSTSAVSGTFAGAPEGKMIALGNGYNGRITYLATGDATAGNDIRISNVTAGVPGTTLLFR